MPLSALRPRELARQVASEGRLLDVSNLLLGHVCDASVLVGRVEML
jgi:hypothetical protein